MSTKLMRWGNSLGVRIPKAAAEASMVCEGTVVEVTARKGEIVIRPVRKRKYKLSELLAKMKPENLHGEVDWGPPVGKEFW
ncbi:AbrB/MazE/SpoVT family DNA-binding domain-containing protein [bacterium]|nr:MAG: AbrB/MazE/SpoVT family DNA-binding domain-containing protein [bacterium]